jgi:PleD family two-component response regulator
VVRRLRDAVARRVLASGDAIDASFGVSVYQPGDDPERLVVRADDALYQAKRRREESAA